MFYHNVRITTVVWVIIIAFFVLLGGKYLYDLYSDKDLTKEINRFAKVKSINIERNETPPTIYLHLEEIADLGKTYPQLRKIIDNNLGSECQIVLVDEPTDDLQELYNDCHFIVYEAVATGNFQQMYENVKTISGEAQVNWKISMDADHIYLQFSNEQGYLYKVIDRYPQQLAQITNHN